MEPADERAILRALLRDDLAAFIQFAFVTVTGEKYHDNWHIHVIAWHLQEVAAGRIKRLIINLPPRHLKSICVSVAFTAWILGHNPTWKLLCASYSLALAKKLSYDCRLVMQSALYKQIFPQARIDPHKSTELEFALTKHGYRLACSLESGVTGRGGNMLILDDPMTPDQAYSASEREKVQERYQSTLYSRLNNKSTDAIILVMQRLHDEDLTGYLLDKDEWTHVKIPALSTQPETYWAGCELRRAANRPLDEYREPLPELERIRKRMGNYHFEAQFQQQPTYSGLSIVPMDKFKTYDPNSIPSFECVVQSWDTASKPGEMNDYSVCTTWGVRGDCSFLLDVKRVRLEFPALKQLIKSHGVKADVIFIEDAGSGIALIQQLQHEDYYPLHAKPRGDKITRMVAQTAPIDAGAVFLPTHAPWLSVFQNEVSVFPNGKHDDQVDSMSQFLEGREGILRQFRINPLVRMHLQKRPRSSW